MERITQWAFRNRAAVIVLVVLVLTLGISSYFTLPKELLPAANQPEITVTVLGQGIDAGTMVAEVTKPLEDALATIPGKQDVLSTTSNGWAELNISFDSKTKMKDAKTNIQDALSNVTLPTGVSKPNVVSLNTSMIPVAEVALSFPNGLTSDNLNLVENQVAPKFQAIGGVASAPVYGANVGQVVIQLDNTKLAKLHLPLQTLLGVLKGQNVTTSVGTQTIAGSASNIQVIGKVTTLADLGNLMVVPHVKLSDVATIQKQNDASSITRVNGQDAMVIVVTKTANSNAVDVGNAVQKEADALNVQYHSRMSVSVPVSTATAVVHSVNSMMREVLLGALFATAVILLFLRSFRLTVITIVSIPLSLALTLFLLGMSGVTLNILTLGAIAVAVGRLVDDSIVVIENAYRKSRDEGVSPATMVAATKEVATAITSSTLTTVAVFLPIGLVQGQLQSLLLPFALTVVYSLLSSLLVALTVVPILGSVMMKPRHGKRVKGSNRKPKRYLRWLTWSLNHKWVPLLLAAVIFVGAGVAYKVMPKGAIDTSDLSTVNVTLTYPSATPLSQVKSGALQLESYIRKQYEANTTILLLGNSASNASYGQLNNNSEAQFSVIMKKNSNTDTFIKDVLTQKANYPKATLAAFASAGYGGSNTININLYGKNTSALANASTLVTHAVKDIAGVQKVSTNQQDTKPTYQVKVNAQVANAAQIAQQLQMLLNQVPIGSMTLNTQNIPVVLAPTQTLASSSDLSNLMVSTPTGLVKLSSIATVTEVNQPGTILRKNGNEFVQVAVQVDAKKLSTISTQIGLQTKTVKLPSGITMEVGGASAQQNSQFGDLGKTMLASIGIVYLIMVLTFKTLRVPLAILFALPLAGAGAILGLLVTRTSVDPSALIGILMLIGIVVTNAIVLLDRVRQNEQHETIREAILEASQTRVRPILMTATATICAMIPLLFSKPETGSVVSKSLAVVVIGGLTVSTLLTLIIVPVVYELLFYRKSQRQRLAAKSTGSFGTSH